MAIFKGAGVAIVTPMYEDGKVNYDKLEELLEYQIANSTDAIIICGTTGESSTMTHGEHLKTIKFAIDKVNKRVPVIAGTGSNCTETAIMMSKEAASYGADALLIVTPYYNKATQKGLIAHYTAIAEAVPETPIIMYNVPSRTGCDAAHTCYREKSPKYCCQYELQVTDITDHRSHHVSVFIGVCRTLEECFVEFVEFFF